MQPPVDPKLELESLLIAFPPILIFLVQCLLKMEAKMDQLRALVEAADKDKVELLNQLEEERR